MLRKTVSVIMLTLLLTSTLTLVFDIQPVRTSGTICNRSDYSIDLLGLPTRRNGDLLMQNSVDWWPTFHHDASHTGFTTSSGPTAGNKLWSYKIGPWEDSSPAVVDGRVYVGSGDGNIYCLDATSGAFIWSHTTGALFTYSSPAVVDGRVYTGSYDHNVYCLDASTGTLIWSYTTGGWTYSSPAVVDGRVYTGSYDHNVYCLDASTGTLIWSYTTGAEVPSSPAVANGRVYIGSCDHNVYCLDASTGKNIWSYTTGDFVWSSPAVANGRVYIGSEDGNIYCLDATSGAFIWSHTTGFIENSCAAVAGNRVYVGSWDFNVYCLDATTGALIWSYTTGAWVDSSPALADGKVYVGSYDSNVYCLDAATGDLIWSYTAPPDGWQGSIACSPAVVDGKVYVGSENGNIYCLGELPYTPSPNNLVADPVDAFAIGCTLAIHLWWEPPQSPQYPVQGYKIYRGSCSTQKTLIATVDSSKTDHLDHVEAKGIYYYDVAAVYAQGDSMPSNEAVCATMESFSGIENIIHLDSLNVGPGEWIPHVFTIQQNVKIPLFTSVVCNWGYWVQNVIWIDPNEMWMGGSIQVFEIYDNEIGEFPFARFPQTYPVPYYRVGQFNSTVALKMTIEGDTLRIINPCNWQSFDLELPVVGAGDHFLSVWTTWRENAPFTTLVYDKSPELVIVNNPIDQNPIINPRSTGVHFGPGTSGSVDSYIRVDTASGSKWLRCTSNGVVMWGQASTAEESTGLHWEASGSFTYNAAYDSTNTAEEGLWCWPNYYDPVANVPSIAWAPGLASISFNVFCPAYLNLYDQFGNLLGFDPAKNVFVNQIPESGGLSNQSLFVFNPSGTYHIEVIGTDNGTYELNTSWQDVTGTTVAVLDLNGTITESETQTYIIGQNANVVLTGVLPSKTIVGQGFSMQINARISDLGEPDSTFNVTLYANETVIGTQSMLNLSGWSSTNVSFTWNTTGFAKGNYTIWAYASPVANETDTADNTCTDGWVIVSMVGDITGGPGGYPDGKCDMKDVRAVAKLFGVNYPDPKYNPNCDINNDRKIDMKDIRAVAKEFGKTDP